MRSFFSSSKWDIKQQRQLATSTMHLAQELVANVQCSGDSSSFARRREPWRCGWPSEVDNNQLRVSIEADTLIATGEVAKELNIDHSMVIWHLKQIRKVTMLYKSVPRKQTANQKIFKNHFEGSSSLTLCNNNETLMTEKCLNQIVWQKLDFIWQPAMTCSVVGPRRSSKALPKAKLAPKKKVMVTVWWSAAGLIHYRFLSPGKTITSEKYVQQISEMHRKLQVL